MGISAMQTTSIASSMGTEREWQFAPEGGVPKPPSSTGGDSSVGDDSDLVYQRSAPWTPKEDARLTDLVHEHGARNWKFIAEFLPGRNCKACRLRWMNQLRDGLKRDPFTAEEDAMLMKMHARLGNKWSQIAKRLPGRTDNTVKNRYHTLIKQAQKQGKQQLAEQATVAEVAAADLTPEERAQYVQVVGALRAAGVAQDFLDILQPRRVMELARLAGEGDPRASLMLLAGNPALMGSMACAAVGKQPPAAMPAQQQAAPAPQAAAAHAQPVAPVASAPAAPAAPSVAAQPPSEPAVSTNTSSSPLQRPSAPKARPALPKRHRGMPETAHVRRIADQKRRLPSGLRLEPLPDMVMEPAHSQPSPATAAPSTLSLALAAAPAPAPAAASGSAPVAPATAATSVTSGTAPQPGTAAAAAAALAVAPIQSLVARQASTASCIPDACSLPQPPEDLALLASSSTDMLAALGIGCESPLASPRAGAQQRATTDSLQAARKQRRASANAPGNGEGFVWQSGGFTPASGPFYVAKKAPPLQQVSGKQAAMTPAQAQASGSMAPPPNRAFTGTPRASGDGGALYGGFQQRHAGPAEEEGFMWQLAGNDVMQTGSSYPHQQAQQPPTSAPYSAPPAASQLQAPSSAPQQESDWELGGVDLMDIVLEGTPCHVPAAKHASSPYGGKAAAFGGKTAAFGGKAAAAAAAAFGGKGAAAQYGGKRGAHDGGKALTQFGGKAAAQFGGKAAAQFGGKAPAQFGGKAATAASAAAVGGGEAEGHADEPASWAAEVAASMGGASAAQAEAWAWLHEPIEYAGSMHQSYEFDMW